MHPKLAQLFHGRTADQVRAEMVERRDRAKDERSRALWGRLANFTFREAEQMSTIPNVPDDALAKMSVKLRSAISVAMASGGHMPSPEHCRQILLKTLDEGVRLGFRLTPTPKAKEA
jgi:hypothetical protein